MKRFWDWFLNGSLFDFAAISSAAVATGRGVRDFRLPRDRLPDLALVGAVVILITAANMVWVHEETRPPHFDMAGHLWSSLFYLDRLESLDLVSFFGTYIVYPPMVYWVADPFYLVFGRDISVAVLSQSILLCVLAFSMYGLGATLWSRRVGLLATAFVLTLPMMVTQFKEFLLDAPITAMTALSLLMLIRTREFADRGNSKWLGAALGLAMLTKWVIAMLMFLPLAYALFIAVQVRLQQGSNERLFNVARCAIVGLIIAAPWYLGHIDLLINTQLHLAGTTGAIEGDPPIFSSESNQYYFWAFINGQMYVVPFLLFCVGLVLLLVRRDNARQNLYPLLLIAGTYVIFTLLRNKDWRSTEGMFAGVGVISVYWIDQIRVRALKEFASLGVVVYGVIAFVAISFGLSFLPRQENKIIAGELVVIFAQHGYIIGPPSGEHWYQEDLYQTISSQDALPKTLYYDDREVKEGLWFNVPGLRYFGYRYHVRNVQEQAQASFVAQRVPRNARPNVPAAFTQIATYSLPDRTTLVLLQRNADPANSNAQSAPAPAPAAPGTPSPT